MIRRGVAVGLGVAAAGAGVGATVGDWVAVGAGINPGPGADAAGRVGVVVVTPASPVLVGATVGALEGAAGGAVTTPAVTTPAVAPPACPAPDPTAFDDGEAAGAVDAGSPPGVRIASASAVESRSAASRALRDSSARDTPNHDPASTASDVAATNRLTSVRRTTAPKARPPPPVESELAQETQGGFVRNTDSFSATIPSRISFGEGCEVVGGCL